MNFKSQPKHSVWIHTVAAVVWLLLAIPTVLIWADSILWVAFMSLYANIVGHWSARQAAKAEVQAGDSA